MHLCYTKDIEEHRGENMTNAPDKTVVMTENLRDMCLSNKSIAQCLQMVENEQLQALERFLKSYRQTLLDSVHKYNDRID